MLRARSCALLLLSVPALAEARGGDAVATTPDGTFNGASRPCSDQMCCCSAFQPAGRRASLVWERRLPHGARPLCSRAAGFVENGTKKWLGVPYAEPPVGDLRWRKTVPKAQLSSPLDTKTYSADCPQIGPGWPSLGGMIKDCHNFMRGCPNMTWSEKTNEDCVSSLSPPADAHRTCRVSPCATRAAALPERVRAGEQH